MAIANDSWETELDVADASTLKPCDMKVVKEGVVPALLLSPLHFVSEPQAEDLDWFVDKPSIAAGTFAPVGREECRFKMEGSHVNEMIPDGVNDDHS